MVSILIILIIPTALLVCSAVDDLLAPMINNAERLAAYFAILISFLLTMLISYTGALILS